MAIEGVHDATLSQVPDLDGSISGSRNERSSRVIESNGVHTVIMRIIMLQESLRSAIEYLDLFVGAA